MIQSRTCACSTARKQINGQFISKSNDALDANSASVRPIMDTESVSAIWSCSVPLIVKNVTHSTQLCVCVCVWARSQGAQHHSQSTTNTSHPVKRADDFQQPSFSFIYSSYLKRASTLMRWHALFSYKCLIGLIRQQRGWSRKENQRAPLGARVHLCA